MGSISPDELINDVLSIPTEDRSDEFKRLGNEFSVSKVIQSAVAMANTDGGWIFLGVDDPQKSRLKGLDRVFGIEENHEKYDEIERNISRITPPVSYLWPPLLLTYPQGKTVRKIIDNPDTSKVSRLLRKWVKQGLLIKIETGSKKTVKYRLPVDKGQEYLFAKGNANKT